MTSDSVSIIFGLKDYPRPRQSGFFYHKPPTLLGNFQIETLAVLDLYVTDENYLYNIFSEGIDKLLAKPEFAENKTHYLTHYDTENMKDFVRAILDRVITDKL